MRTLKRLLDFLFPWRYCGTVVYDYEGTRIIASVYLNRWNGTYHNFEEV